VFVGQPFFLWFGMLTTSLDPYEKGIFLERNWFEPVIDITLYHVQEPELS
jgi:hypothetical protein